MRADDDTRGQAAADKPARPLGQTEPGRPGRPGHRGAAPRRGQAGRPVACRRGAGLDRLDQCRPAGPGRRRRTGRRRARRRGADRGTRPAGRRWVSPPRASLTFSLLVRPDTVSPARRGWLPLLAGVSVASAVRAAAEVDARLKWPNDVLVGPAKLGGILAEAVGDAVVVGIGLNVSTEPGELPPPGPSPGRRAARDLFRALAAPGREPGAVTGDGCSPRSWPSSSTGTRPGGRPPVIPTGAGCGPSTPGCAPRSAAVSG